MNTQHSATDTADDTVSVPREIHDAMLRLVDGVADLATLAYLGADRDLRIAAQDVGDLATQIQRDIPTYC